jgi:hypothetical protein
MIESVTWALPPLLANTGTEFVWQEYPVVQVIWALASEHHKEMYSPLPSFITFLLTTLYYWYCLSCWEPAFCPAGKDDDNSGDPSQP